VTTGAPTATAAGRPGPDLPGRQATTGGISARSAAEVFGALESSSRGLAAAEAASRLAALDPNELRAAKRPPVIKKVLAQFTNLFALVLLGASVITFASYLIQSPRDTGSLEPTVAILAVVVLGFGHFTAANPVYREARTMVQVGIVVSQFFNSLTVRSEDQSIPTIGVFTNRRLLLAGAFGIVLVSCISYIPALQSVFGTAGLTGWDWLMLTGFGLVLLLADEGRKAVVLRVPKISSTRVGGATAAACCERPGQRNAAANSRAWPSGA